MSGFVATFDWSSKAIDRRFLDKLVDTLRFRGPDSQHVWIDGPIGFGLAELRTMDETLGTPRPLAIDGTLAIVGDIRIDGRQALTAKLLANGEAVTAATGDSELLLGAYRVWGPALLDHVIGDFSFALWDGARRQILCARDHFGVKPLFYAVTGSVLIVSNTLSCIRSHPEISSDLDDAAVGDFLLFGFNANPATTTFAAIKRVPGGARLTSRSGEGMRVESYWTLPSYAERRLPKREDYIEQFRHLLAEAVSDRIRANEVCVHLSGGLDSSLIAATAHRQMLGGNGDRSLSGLTVVYEKLFDDDEIQFSRLGATSLGISLQQLAADDFQLFDWPSGFEHVFPEPLDGLARPGLVTAFSKATSAAGRVALTGYDGDALLTSSWTAQLKDDLDGRRFARAIANVIGYIGAKQGLAAALARRLPWRPSAAVADPGFPSWLNPAFVESGQLRARWEQSAVRRRGEGPRDGAYAAMTEPYWLAILECLDAGFTGVPVDHRHPLLDLRIVEFCLSLPAIPWCIDKHLFREAVRDQLPEPIRLRPKSPLGGDPLPPLIRRYRERQGDALDLHPSMGRYLDISQKAAIIDELGTDGYWFSLRALTLNFWLNHY
jgi:asparagine synthase (glutamine-hydrolysing)